MRVASRKIPTPPPAVISDSARTIWGQPPHCHPARSRGTLRSTSNCHSERSASACESQVEESLPRPRLSFRAQRGSSNRRAGWGLFSLFEAGARLPASHHSSHRLNQLRRIVSNPVLEHRLHILNVINLLRRIPLDHHQV